MGLVLLAARTHGKMYQRFINLQGTYRKANAGLDGSRIDNPDLYMDLY